MAPLLPVKVPKQLEDIFSRNAGAIANYFGRRADVPMKGTIAIGGERYIMARASSMSVDLFETVCDFFKNSGEKQASNIAVSMLFDIAHAIGMSDAKYFHEKLMLESPIDKLSAGPLHFAYTGWAFVDIRPESNPSLDQNFFLLYSHPYSFESDAWKSKRVDAAVPICVMNAGYSSGWCEASFGIPLVAVEVTCRAHGDAEDLFIMAPPRKIDQHIKRFLKGKKSAARIAEYVVPGFLNSRIQEDVLKKKNAELEEMNSALVDRELKMIELKEVVKRLKAELASKPRRKTSKK